MKTEALDVLKSRRSIRKYKSEQISDEELKTVLEAGTYGATGGGTQSPTIIAVQDPELIKLLNKLNADVMGQPDAIPYYDAPTILLTFASAKALTPDEDAIIVAANMLNASYAAGLGSCWIHRSKQMFESEEGKKLKAEFGIAEDGYCMSSIALGYADCEQPEAKPRKENYYLIIK